MAVHPGACLLLKNLEHRLEVVDAGLVRAVEACEDVQKTAVLAVCCHLECRPLDAIVRIPFSVL